MHVTQRRAAPDREIHIASLLHHLGRHRRALENRSSLGLADLRLLWLFTDGQARSLRQISEELHLEQSTVNRQVNAAVKAGTIHRFRAADRSPFMFEPTTEGRQRFEAETVASIGLYARVLDEMGTEDTARLLDLLGRFVELYGAAIADRETSAA